MFHTILGLERALPWLSLALACGYLIGSIPVGVLIAKALRLGDLRAIGSGNIGATNVLRTGNKGAAAATLLLDALKGAVAVLIFAQWGPLPSQLAGLGVFLGHCFPLWLRFRGGKGVAPSLGVMFGLHWPAGLACLGVWLAAALIVRMSSVAALLAAASAPLWLALMDRWGPVLLTTVLAALIWLRHADNIRRLIRGEEPKIGRRPKP